MKVQRGNSAPWVMVPAAAMTRVVRVDARARMGKEVSYLSYAVIVIACRMGFFFFKRYVCIYWER